MIKNYFKIKVGNILEGHLEGHTLENLSFGVNVQFI